MSDTPSPLARFVEEIRGRLREVEQLDWRPPDPPPEAPPLNVPRLVWKPSERASLTDAISLDDLRKQLPATMKKYAHPKTKTEEILLVKVAAGGGKTHAGVELAQWAAARGQRVLWAAGRHNMLDDLRLFPGFNPAQWYHWLPIREAQGEDDPLPATCRYAAASHLWTQKGYNAFDLCWQLCSYDQHIHRCTYRRQAMQTQPIIFAMHHHLASGLAISRFDLAIVDELPVQAFVERRLIPRDGIRVPGASGPVATLLDQLYELSGGETRSGRALLDVIGPTLERVYEYIDALPDEALPVVPRVYRPDDVEHKPWWFVAQMLKLAALEYKAWKAGWDRWAERIFVTGEGLGLLDRAEPWTHLPKKIAVLDATAQPGLYRQIFDRPVREYQPAVKRAGKLYQITGRLNGKGTLLGDGKEKKPTSKAREELDIARQIAEPYRQRGERVSVICAQGLRVLFEAEFGDDNVEHFYALRGTNSLQDAACLIVVGAPSPDIQTVIRDATALSPFRQQAFGEIDEQGRVKPVFTRIEREYRIGDALRAEHGGMSPWRLVGGFWGDAALQNLYDQYREAELVQAMHRSRMNVRACDVWLLTSLPTAESLDGIWHDPPPQAGFPAGIPWKRWLKIEPWLQERHEPITYAELAKAAGVVETTARKNRWLDVIREHQPGEWDSEVLKRAGSGGGKKALVRRA